MDGFSFCGVPISNFNLYYVPLLHDTYFYDNNTYNINELIFLSHDGGYFYGATVQPKIFTLRCYFYDLHINQGILSSVGNFFKRGRTGKLVFLKRDWMYYNATVVGLDMTNLTSKFNGFVIITLKAYYPFAMTDKSYITRLEFVSSTIAQNSALLLLLQTPSKVIIGEDDNPILQLQSFLLYNGGYLRASCSIKISGLFGDGVTIYNKTTGQKCTLIKSDELNNGLYIICDSMNGKVVAVNLDSGDTRYMFICHDDGFIDILAGGQIKRNAVITIGLGDDIARGNECFSLSSLGQYVFIYDKSKLDLLDKFANGLWVKITEYIDLSNVRLEKIVYEKTSTTSLNNMQYSYTTDIVTMNLISIIPKTTMYIQQLLFIYKPTFK